MIVLLKTSVLKGVSITLGERLLSVLDYIVGEIIHEAPMPGGSTREFRLPFGQEAAIVHSDGTISALLHANDVVHFRDMHGKLIARKWRLRILAEGERVVLDDDEILQAKWQTMESSEAMHRATR